MNIMRVEKTTKNGKKIGEKEKKGPAIVSIECNERMCVCCVLVDTGYVCTNYNVA